MIIRAESIEAGVGLVVLGEVDGAVSWIHGYGFMFHPPHGDDGARACLAEPGRRYFEDIAVCERGFAEAGLEGACRIRQHCFLAREPAPPGCRAAGTVHDGTCKGALRRDQFTVAHLDRGCATAEALEAALQRQGIVGRRVRPTEPGGWAAGRNRSALVVSHQCQRARSRIHVHHGHAIVAIRCRCAVVHRIAGPPEGPVGESFGKLQKLESGRCICDRSQRGSGYIRAEPGPRVCRREPGEQRGERDAGARASAVANQAASG